MSQLTLPLAGHCRCGEIHFRISALPILTMACHCSGCQRMSASAYSLSAAIPARGFEVTRGEPVLGGLRDPELRHFFCPSCMTWMFTRPPEAVTQFLPRFVNVRPTMLDDPSWCSPFVETWTKAKLPWVTTPAAYSYAEFPPVEDYPMLLAEFAKRQVWQPDHPAK